jgi:acetolactate decarboxylase
MLVSLSISACANLPAKNDVLFQASTIDALLVGVYEGDMTFAELKRHGDFGLGTFNNLDGEMIALDGKFYQVKDDGIAYPVEDSMKTPFSVVTFFEPDESFDMDEKLNDAQLKKYLDGRIPTENIFYAFKIEGIFGYVKTRSVPAQKKPYPALVEAVKHQSVFELHDVKGTIVGFRTPGFVKGVNVPGYHLHFITEDRKAGGHVLAFRVENACIKTDSMSELCVVLPKSAGFAEADLTKEQHGELEAVEKDRNTNR